MNSGERRVISSVALQAQDLDTPSNQVFFLLNAEPHFGKLLLKVGIVSTPSPSNLVKSLAMTSVSFSFRRRGRVGPS